MLTPEELLIPRAKLENDYPLSTFNVGDIVTGEHAVQWYTLFPANFKKMEWWQERRLEDMPEYVKVIGTGEVFYVYEWDLTNYFQAWAKKGDAWILHTRITPSTKDEYETNKK